MIHRCKCTAKARICTGTNYKLLEFHGTHDETSHAKDYSKSLTYKQIATIHEAVMVAPGQSATTLRRNRMQAQGSPEQHKHISPSKLRCIQRCVHTERKNSTQQKLAAASVPESIGEQLRGARRMIFSPQCAGTTTRPMSIAFHFIPHLFLVVISKWKEKPFTSAFPMHGF